MNYDTMITVMDFLSRRFRQAGMRHYWYEWAVDHSWERVRKWAKHLGYPR